MKTIVSFAHMQVGNVRIDFRRGQAGVAEHLLDEADVRPAFQHQRRHRMPKVVNSMMADPQLPQQSIEGSPPSILPGAARCIRLPRRAPDARAAPSSRRG